MPRQSDSKAMGTQFYHSQFNNAPYNAVADSSAPPPLTTSQPQTPAPAAAATTTTTTGSGCAPKKKHFCPTCDRAFTTSGHLARHSRVHTGERNHKCPFPGCETRCSRQDNLQQHYRIHLSPGSRRSSTRSAIARAMNGGTGASNRRGSTVSNSNSSPDAPPPLSAPPALEPARGYSMSTPPDSPPPLAQATLPPGVHHPPESVSSRSSSSPDVSYSPLSPHHPHLVPMNGHSMSLHSHPYSYRSGTTTYQEQSQGAGFTYVHTTPISHSSGMSYHGNNGNYDHHSLPHINTSSSPMSSQELSTASSSSANHVSSRHSISHISHPQSSYGSSHHSSHAGHSSASPPSPSSVSSHASGPTTPTYPVYADDAHAYNNSGLVLEHGPDQSSMAGGHINTQGHLVHPSYSPTIPSRFDSPPPVLAPIQDERVRGSGERGQANGNGSSPYLHHPQPMGNEYQYHQNLGLSHGAWKAESGMRNKALVQ